MADRKGPVIFGIPGNADGGAAVSVSRMGHITEADKDAALEIAVRGLLGDARRSSPVDYAGPKRESAPASGPGTGWRDRGPLVPPPGIAAIDRMVEAMQPHQPGNPEYRGPVQPEAGAQPTAEAAPVSAAPKAEAVAEAPPAAAEVTRRRLT
jgi:hypothetical protein